MTPGSVKPRRVELFPAIDLLDGACVRLYKGDYSQATTYGDDPVGQARQFIDEGARWVHMVDLNAARTGEAHNRDQIAAVAELLSGSGALLQVGGGVRDDAAARALLDVGVDRVVIGTAAVADPDWVRRLAGRCPGQVAVGLDARGSQVAVQGWTEDAGRDLIEMARRFAESGVAALVVTEIGRDGTLEGPATEQLAAVLEASEIDLVASGGVGALDDLRALAALQAGGRSLAGVIVGRAIYEGKLTVSQAIGALAAEAPADVAVTEI